MCFLNMHVHKIYKLNNNRRKKFLFQINSIPIPAPSVPPENLKFCPTELKTTTLPSGAP